MMQKRRSLTLLREASLVEHLAQKTRWLRAPLVEARLEGRLARVYLELAENKCIMSYLAVRNWISIAPHFERVLHFRLYFLQEVPFLPLFFCPTTRRDSWSVRPGPR